jgi:hypothetical protein
MTIQIYVPQDLEIPDDEVPRIIQHFRERFADADGTPLKGPVSKYDFVVQAVIDGLIEEPPEGWMMDGCELPEEDAYMDG